MTAEAAFCEVNVKVKIILEQAMTAERMSRGKLYSLFNLGPRLGWVVNATPRPIYPGERDMVQEAGWVKVKVKFSLLRPIKAQRVIEV